MYRAGSWADPLRLELSLCRLVNLLRYTICICTIFECSWRLDGRKCQLTIIVSFLPRSSLGCLSEDGNDGNVTLPQRPPEPVVRCRPRVADRHRYVGLGVVLREEQGLSGVLDRFCLGDEDLLLSRGNGVVRGPHHRDRRGELLYTTSISARSASPRVRIVLPSLPSYQ